MAKKTVRDVILSILRERGRMRKGALEDLLRYRMGTYGDTTSRRLREMTEAGEVIRIVDREGVSWYDLPRPMMQLGLGESIGGAP